MDDELKDYKKSGQELKTEKWWVKDKSEGTKPKWMGLQLVILST